MYQIFIYSYDNNIPLYTTFWLSIHQLMDICVVSTYWLLWIVLLWTFLYKFLFEQLILILLDIYLGVGLLGHMVVLCLTFLRNCQTVFHSSCTYDILTSIAWEFQFLPILAVTCYFLFSFKFYFKKLIYCHYYNYPSGYEVMSPCCFDLHFPND